MISDEFDEHKPIPVRFWWLKRIAVAVVVFLAVFAAVRWIVGRHVKAMIQERFAAARARGEKTLLSDFQHPWPPDDQNAAVLLEQAAVIMPTKAITRNALEDIAWTTSMKPADLALARRSFEQDAAGLALVRQARSRPMVDWHVEYSTPALDMAFPFLLPQRGVTAHLANAAFYAHKTSDDAAAIEYVRDILFVANAIDQIPALVPHAFAESVINLRAIETLQSCLPTLSIGDPTVMKSSKALVLDLLDEQPSGGGLAAAIKGERIMRYDKMQRIQSTGNSMIPMIFVWGEGEYPQIFQRSNVRRLMSWVYSPMLERDWLTFFDYDTAAAFAASQPDWPSASSALPSRPRNEWRLWADMFFGPADYRSWISRPYKLRRYRRTAAIALAAKLYEVDHGHPPATLGEMVPAYLPSVPLDPMAGGGMSMPYSPATRPATLPGAQ